MFSMPHYFLVTFDIVFKRLLCICLLPARHSVMTGHMAVKCGALLGEGCLDSIRIHYIISAVSSHVGGCSIDIVSHVWAYYGLSRYFSNSLIKFRVLVEETGLTHKPKHVCFFAYNLENGKRCSVYNDMVVCTISIPINLKNFKWYIFSKRNQRASRAPCLRHT